LKCREESVCEETLLPFLLYKIIRRKQAIAAIKEEIEVIRESVVLL